MRRAPTQSSLLQYVVALVAVVIALGLSLLFRQLIALNPFLIFFAAITISAWYGGLWPGLFATLLSLVSTSIFFISPTEVLKADGTTLVRLMFFLLVATLISSLSGQRKSAQRQARRTAERDQFINQASELLNSSLDEQATLQSLTQLAIPHLGDWCRIELADQEGVLRLVAAAHQDPAKESLIYELEQRYPHLPDAREGPQHVFCTGIAELYPQVTDAMAVAITQDARHLEILRSIGFSSVMVVPLKARNHMLGVISFIATQSRYRYSQEDLRIAKDLARRAAGAIENSRLYQTVEQALLRAEQSSERLQESIRLRDHFLALAAHELKTPMTSVLGNAQLLQRQIEQEQLGGERGKMRIRMLVEQVQRLKRLIDLLLDLSRIQEGRLRLDLQQFDLREVLAQIVAEHQPTLVHHQLELSTADEPCLMMGDRVRLEQVVQNLISNAVKYSPEGGPIQLELSRKDGQVSCTIRDQGIGIPAEAQDQIFERFYRAKNVDVEQTSGMGIGLYIVKEIVSLHDGTIRVKSVEGHGSSFEICLPLA